MNSSTTAPAAPARLEALDVAKCVACFFVIFIHTYNPDNPVHLFILAFSRFAVPLFFMITGYFWKPEKAHKRLLYILKLTIVATVVFIAWAFVEWWLQGMDIKTKLSDWFTWSHLRSSVLFNITPFGGHLWYMYALLYAGFLLSLVDERRLRQLHVLIVPLLLVSFAVGFHRHTFLSRNWLMMAMPYMLLGHWVKCHSTDPWFENLSRKWLVAMLLLSTLTLMFEQWLYPHLGANVSRDMYLTHTLVSLSILMIALKTTGVQPTNPAVTIGRDYSSWIYLYHPLFVVPLAVTSFPVNWHTIPVFAMTVLSIWAIRRLSRALRHA